MSVRTVDSCADLDRRSVDDDLAPGSVPAGSERRVPTAPGARDHQEALMLRLCRIMTAVSIRAGNAREPALSATQVRVLTMLAAADSGLSLKGVADCLGATASAASRSCTRLVRAGLVDRDPGPGNEIRLSLSQAGAELLGEVNRDRLHRIDSLLESLSASQRATVLRGVELLARACAGQPQTW